MQSFKVIADLVPFYTPEAKNLIKEDLAGFTPFEKEFAENNFITSYDSNVFTVICRKCGGTIMSIMQLHFSLASISIPPSIAMKCINEIMAFSTPFCST